jgi:hypothetical protein
MLARIARLVSCAVVVVIAWQSPASAACPSAGGSSCTPAFNTGYDVTAQHTIYVDSSVSQGVIDGLNNAVSGWNNAFISDGKTPPFSVITNPFSAEITVIEDPSLDAGTGALWEPPCTIRVNPQYDSKSSFLNWIMLHELGHAIGWADVTTSSCNGETVMYNVVDTNATSFVTELTAFDQCYTNEKLNPPPAIDPPGSTNPRQWSGGCGETCSPIVINFGSNNYDLTGASDPVWFNMDGSGPSLIGWTARRDADEAFLWLDRNHNGRVTSGAELFGNFTPLKNGQIASNGFEALKEYDDNNDGVIDANDAVWTQLMLWRDLNHDGISQPEEITPVAGSGLIRIELAYHWTGRRDQWGNTFRYESKAWIQKHNGNATPHPLYDIFFVHVN